MSDQSSQHLLNRPISSSNRGAADFDAVVMQNAIVGGPVRLPLEGAEHFVCEFNARYKEVGLSVRANEKSPATSAIDIAGDGWSFDSVGQRNRPNVS